MLDTLRDRHKSESIAVLGSAPSVKMFQREEDVVIGVNGAGQLLEGNDYFLSGDEGSYKKSWYLSLPETIRCILRPHAAIYSERFYPDPDVREEMVRFYETYMDEHPEDVVFKENINLRYVALEVKAIDDFFDEIQVPNPPNIILRQVARQEPISKEQKRINVGGTSACMAVQIAYIMGAVEIHLYGVEFSNNIPPGYAYKGGNYFYRPKPNETGMTLPSQRQFMDDIIRQIQVDNVPVISHGPTRLENTIKSVEPIEN